MKNIEKITLEDWLAELKPYQRDSIVVLIQKFGEDKAAEIWITSNGPSNIVQFGGDSQVSQPFFENFKTEFKKFICGHPDYEVYRKKLDSELPIINAIYISTIAGAIAVTLGFAASLLAPAVAILLSSMGKMGINAFCTGFAVDPPKLSE